MTGRSKTPIIISVIALVVIAGSCALIAAITYSGTTPQPGDSQAAVVEVFGLPDYFVVQYLPRDEDGSQVLVRSESWHYVDHGQSVAFLEGLSVSIDELEATEGGIVYPEADPRDFDYEMSIDEVAATLGYEFERVDDVVDPTLAEENGEVYLGESAIVGFQDGYLVHVETFGIVGGGGE